MKSFKVPIKSDDIYADLAGDVRTRYHTFNYKVTIPRQKPKKVIILMKDGLVGN